MMSDGMTWAKAFHDVGITLALAVGVPFWFVFWARVLMGEPDKETNNDER